MKKLLLLTVLALVATVTTASAAYKVGVLSDLTGPTSSVGTPYAEGIKAYVAWLNENGGIGGEPVELIQVDYAYNVQQALAAYKRFTSEGIVAMQGWGTGDTEALVKFVAKDKIPVFSASYSAHLMDLSNLLGLVPNSHDTVNLLLFLFILMNLLNLFQKLNSLYPIEISRISGEISYS